MTSDIEQSQKDYLLSDIYSNERYYPDHDFVHSWNTDVDTSSKSTDTPSFNKGFIRSAWVDLLAIMPSVKVNDSLYVSSDLETLVSSGHKISVPIGTDFGDCKTERRVTANRGDLSLLVDGEEVGNSKVDNFRISGLDGQKFELTARYDVYVQIEERHYQKLCRRSCGCDYQYSSYPSSHLVITDSQNVTHSKPSFHADFEVVDEYADTSKAIFSHSDPVSLVLDLGDASYTKHNYVFSEELTNAPVNTLQVVAIKQEAKELEGIIKDDFLTFPQTDSCQLQMWDFFHPVLLSCSTNFDDVDFVIFTDKVQYQVGETISLTIEPEANYLVHYAGQEFETTGKLTLNATNDGHIEVSSGYVSESHVVQIQQQNNVSILVALCSFSLCSLGIFKTLKRKGGVLFD